MMGILPRPPKKNGLVIHIPNDDYWLILSRDRKPPRERIQVFEIYVGDKEM